MKIHITAQDRSILLNALSVRKDINWWFLTDCCLKLVYLTVRLEKEGRGR